MKFTLFLLFCNLLAAHAQHSIKSSTVFRTTEVDTKPQLENSAYRLSQFISENITIPEVSNKKIHIITSFIVEEDGSFSDVKFVHLKSESLIKEDTASENKFEVIPALDFLKTEIVRVISLSDSKWIPATKDGKPVRCLFHYPINIRIE